MSGINILGDGFYKNLRNKAKYLVAAAGLAAAMNLGVQTNTVEAAQLENNKIQNAVVSVSPGPGNFVGNGYFNPEIAKLMVSKYTPTILSTLSKTTGLSVDDIKAAYERMHRDSDEYIAKYGGGSRFRSKLGLDEMNGQNVNFVDCMRAQLSVNQQEFAYLNPAVRGGNDLQKLDWAKSYKNRAACVYTAMSSLQRHGIDANGMLMTDTAKEKFAECMGIDYEDAIKNPKLVLAVPYFADNPSALKDIVDAYKTMPDMNPQVLKKLSEHVNNIKDGPFAYDRSIENKKIGQRNLMMDMNVAKCIQSESDRGFLSLVDIYKAKPHMCNDEVKQYIELGIKTFGNTLKSVKLDEMKVNINGLSEAKDIVPVSGIQKGMLNYLNAKYEYDRGNQGQMLFGQNSSEIPGVQLMNTAVKETVTMDFPRPKNAMNNAHAEALVRRAATVYAQKMKVSGENLKLENVVMNSDGNFTVTFVNPELNKAQQMSFGDNNLGVEKSDIVGGFRMESDGTYSDIPASANPEDILTAKEYKDFVAGTAAGLEVEAKPMSVEWETSAQNASTENSKVEVNSSSQALQNCLGDTVGYSFVDMSGDGIGFSKTTITLNGLTPEAAERIALNTVKEDMAAKGLLTNDSRFNAFLVAEDNKTYKVEVRGENVYCDKGLDKEMTDLKKAAEKDASQYKMNSVHNAMEKVEKALGDISEAGMKRLDAQVKFEEHRSKNNVHHIVESDLYVKEGKELSKNLEKANSNFDKSVEKLSSSVSDLRKATVARFGDNKEAREALNNFDVSLKDYRDALAGNNPEAMKEVKEQVQTMGKNFMEVTGNAVNQEMARDKTQGIDRRIENKELGMNKVNDYMGKVGNDLIDMADARNGYFKGKTMDYYMDSFNSNIEGLRQSVEDRFGDNKVVMDSFDKFEKYALNTQSYFDGSSGAPETDDALNAAKDFMKVAGEVAKREQAIANAPFVVPEQPLDGQYRSMMHTVEKLDGLTGKFAENRVATKMVETLYAKCESRDSVIEKVSDVLAKNSPAFVGEKGKEAALRFTSDICDRVKEKEKAKGKEATLDRSKVNSKGLQGKDSQGISI